MTKKRNNMVIILVLGAIALLIGANALTGMVIDPRGGDDPVVNDTIDINEWTDIQIKYTIPYVDSHFITAGEVIPIDENFGGITLYIHITRDSMSLPSNFRIDLVADSEIIESVMLNNGIAYDAWSDNWYAVFDAEGVTQGLNSAYFDFTGSWDGYDATLTLYGQSIPFVLDSVLIANPDPVKLSNLPIDISVDAYSNTHISWGYEYGGTMSVTIEDNGIGIYVVTVGPSFTETFLDYSYYAAISGPHVLEITFLPMDGKNNDPISDSVNVLVGVGGDAPAFPPNVDRIDVSVTQNVVGGDARNIFLTDWYSDVAVKGTVVTVIDGVLDVKVTVYPADAFLVMKVMITEDGGDLEYTLSKATGYDGAVFTKLIDTDEVSAGLHTISFWGFDSTIATWYKVASFDVPIRAGTTPMATFIIFGLVASGVGVVILIFVLKSKGGKKKGRGGILK